MQNNEVRILPNMIEKNQPQIETHLNERPKPIKKILEQNIRQKFHDTEFGSELLVMTPKTQAIK